MDNIFLILVIILNFLICGWDSFAAGMLWGGATTRFERILSACAMTIGFVGMFYTFILVGVVVGVLGQEFLIATNVVLGIPLIGAGIVITVHSWMQVWRERRWWQFAISIWNSFAIIWDITVWIRSVQALGSIGDLGSLLKGGDARVKAIMFLIVAFILTCLISIGLFKVGMEGARQRAHAGVEA